MKSYKQFEYEKSSCLRLITYTRVRLGDTLEEGDVEGCDLWLAHLLVVEVEPEVMRTVIALVELFSIQV